MNDPENLLPVGRLRVMQIIAAALLMGVTMFLVVVFFLHSQGQGMGPPQAVPMLSLLAGGMLAINLPLSLVGPGLLARSAVRRIADGTWTPAPGTPAPGTDEEKLLMVRQTTLIVALALLEGAAFLGCIAYLIEANPLALGVVALALFVMLLQFPTEGRVRGWLDRHIEMLAQARQPTDPTS